MVQQKLDCVLEKMVTENPHMAGWFADDLGSRSWFPGFSWSSWLAADQQAYRDGAIALTQTFRQGGRPSRTPLPGPGAVAASPRAAGATRPGQHSNAPADGGFVEHHDGQIGYFGPYGCSSQWAAQSSVTRGTAFNSR